jgi:hypothetical protein
MVEYHPPVELVAELGKNHETNASRHESLYKMHERLKQMQHTLMVGLAVLKQEPFRGEEPRCFGLPSSLGTAERGCPLPHTPFAAPGEEGA